MNVLHKVTLESLKRNRVRTIVTIIGIMLSASMICAVTTFASSLRNYLHEYMIYTTGDWHAMLEEAEWETYTDLCADGRVSGSAYGQLLGYADIDSKNEFKPYLYVIGGEKTAFEHTMPIHITSGRYPANGSEILLPEHLQTNGGVSYKIGDVLTLQLGKRMLDGVEMGQRNPCYTSGREGDVLNDEILLVQETRTYTVVGFYQRPTFEPYTAPGYTALTVTDNTLAGSYKYDIYFKADDPEDTNVLMNDYINKYGLGGTTNTDVLMMEGVLHYDSFHTVICSMSLIAIILIMFGSVSLIYNAFSISVSERTRQFGLLSSIGATKKQMKDMVLFEALAVSAVGIPLGIGVGIGGIAVTLQLIGHRFTSLIGYEVPMRVSVSLQSVVIACVVALLTVLISAWIPSHRAMKVSAVEAIRQQQDIKTKEKPIKISRLTYIFFGLPGVLATKHYKRNKKKYRATVASLFMSIVLFVSTSAYTGALMNSMNMGYGMSNFDLRVAAYKSVLQENGITAPELLQQIRKAASVDAAAYSENRSMYMTVDHQYLTPSVADKIDGITGVSMETEDNQAGVRVRTVFVDDEAFRVLLKQYKLDEKSYMNPEAPLAVAVDTSVTFDPTTGKYTELDLLKGHTARLSCTLAKELEGYDYLGYENQPDGTLVYRYVRKSDGVEVQMPEAEVIRHLTLRIGYVIEELPYFVGHSDMLVLIYPLSMTEAVLQDAGGGIYSNNYIYVKAENHTAAETALHDLLAQQDLAKLGVYNAAAGDENDRNIVAIMRVFAYGFIVLISLISAANVFNTISTNISLRRREFAMLKSIGMTAGGFNRMMNFECLLYGSRALLWGLPVSGAIAYVIWLAATDGFEYAFTLPWKAMGIATLCVFAVVFVTMLYAMSKIKKDNPIDALKNENL